MSASFRVLGPLAVTVDESPVPLRSASVRVVLASLLLRRNRVVSVNELIDHLWDSAPPGGARNAAQSYVMRLRKALGAARVLVRTQPGGYLMQVPAEMVDLDRFQARVAAADAARSASDRVAEAAELRAATALWRGEPLSDVPSQLLRAQELPRLVEAHLQTLERLFEVELELGRHARLVGELIALTEEYPLRERLWSQLMLALYRTDRQADALATYRKVRSLLRDELGIEPSRSLCELNQQILRGDIGLASPTSVQMPAVKPWIPPFELPADIPDFVGRSHLLAQLRRLVTDAGSLSSAIPLVILSGPPGVGKTALAVHLAHLLRTEFPDGQLFVDLRGCSAGPPRAVTEVLARFLRALNVPPERAARDVEEQGAQLRSLLTGRKVLMVLDNAAGSEQVRHLLPADRSCAVLITSRDNLLGLTAVNGARRIAVDVISAAEARALVANIVGADRVAADKDAVEAFTAACGFLPLGLRIAATNLAGSTDRSIAEFVDQLLTGNRLDAMEIDGDSQAAVRRAFDQSYRKLAPAPARLFRLLSLLPGPDFDAWVAAAAAGTDPSDTRGLLDQLVAANLLGSRAPGRFHYHDLIREFAAERAVEVDGADQRRDVLRRQLALFMEWARSACRLLYPDERRTAMPRLAAPPPPQWDGPAAALSWLDAETPNLVAAVEAGRDDELPVWALADVLLPYLHHQRRDSLWRPVFAAALEAVERRAGPDARAAVYRGLGRLLFHDGKLAEARTHLTKAVQLFQELSDTAGAARSLTMLGLIAYELQEYDNAIDCYERSLRLVDDDTDAPGRVSTLFDMGMTLIKLGHNLRGRHCLSKALRRADHLGLRDLQVRCMATLALSEMWSGRLAAALTGFQTSLEAWAGLKYPTGVAETVRNIAETALEAQRPDLALRLGRYALAQSKEIESPWLIVGSHVVVGRSALALDDVETATRHFEDANELAVQTPSYWNPAVTRGMAACYRRSGRMVEALELAALAAAEPRPRERARGHIELATALMDSQDHAGAAEHAQRAYELCDEQEYRLDQARAMQVLERAAEAAGDPATAQGLRARAAQLYADALVDTEPQLTVLAERVLGQHGELRT